MSRRKTRKPTRLEDLEIGQRVLLAGKHPHAGKLGRVKGHKPLALLGGRLGTEISLDAGGGCFVFHASHVVPLDARGYPT